VAGSGRPGSRLKLVINAYMATLIEGVAEALALADRLGIDRGKLDEAIEGGPLDAPVADAKLHKMEHGDYAPEFPLEWALKDVDLALVAAGDAPCPSWPPCPGGGMRPSRRATAARTSVRPC
jgi:3-hydroxyisobutyrate dehydrogenase